MERGGVGERAKAGGGPEEGDRRGPESSSHGDLGARGS